MIIVTGGAGFIGSNLVKELNRQGREDIIIVDDLADGANYKNLLGLHFRDYIHKDKFLQQLDGLKHIDAIFHEGACSDTMEYDVNFMMKQNYEYSVALFNYAVENYVPLFYASSASTYGLGEHGFREEEQCEMALNPYAFSKLLFDRYVRQNLHKAKTPVVGLRYFNVYGMQENHKLLKNMASIFLQFYNQINETGEMKLFGPYDGYAAGEQKRDFVFVRDVVKVNLWFFKKNKTSLNGIYNCGTGKAHSYNEVAQAMIKALGKGKISYRDFPEKLKGKYQSFTQADMTKLLSVGYDEGFFEMEDAVKEYCDGLKKNGGYFDYNETK